MSNSNVFTEAIGGLGARLDAMTGTAEVQTVQIPMDEISAREQIRKRFDGDDSTIAELAESIKRDGQIQEIVVRPCEPCKRLVQRRFAPLCGMPTTKKRGESNLPKTCTG